MKKVPYSNAIGSVMYLMVSIRPDIAYSVSGLSRYMSNLGQPHWEALKWLLRYHKHTVSYDSNYANDRDKKKSTTSYVFTLGGSCISWKSQLQHIVALSTIESEYIAITEAMKEALWLKGTKHIDVRFHFIRDIVEKGEVQLEKIHTDHNPADMGTMCLPKMLFCIRKLHIDSVRVFVSEETSGFLSKGSDRFVVKFSCVSEEGLCGYCEADLDLLLFLLRTNQLVNKGLRVGYKRHVQLYLECLKIEGSRSRSLVARSQYVYNQCNNPLKNGVVNVRDAARHYCANLIRKMVFGERFFGLGEEDGGPGSEEREHVDGLFVILSFLYGFAIADFIPWLEVFDFDGHKRIVRNAIKNVRKYNDPVIDKRMEMWRRGLKREEDDILDLLINLKSSDQTKPLLSVREIKAQIIEIMIETVDNPSNAVEWALAEMINQPDILAKACKELDRVVGKDRLVEELDIPNLNYVKACLKESFRIHPLSPFNVPHVSSKDVVVGGYFIPKGSHVLLSRPGLGRNPRIWDEPLRFDPERHIVDESSEVEFVDQELRMLSFSTGRRGCPGILIGSTITTMLLARLIQAFGWRPPLDTDIIDLDESGQDLGLAKPLIAHATPRLNSQIYKQLMSN
ncbi:phenylalanine N-monooxygenase-like [Salvia hispanica]|uniref:phenylalanine N-monooxygenase-like n=1 Tax=Salvia hispanica TaxID=49212 RepID=UPI002008F70E|nr:phenylalanine N-monooxygenase-like [Salvia hispanica]